jgi:hypothetical protein
VDSRRSLSLSIPLGLLSRNILSAQRPSPSPSPTIGQCLNGGYGWLEIECCRSKTKASMPLDAIRRPRDTPIWKLEPSFRCRSCGTRRYKPPVRMIKLTEQREITPYKRVHPDEER